MNTKVVIADDCAITRLATLYSLKAEGNFDVVGETDDGSETVSLVEQLQPDLVLMELSLQGLNSLDALAIIKDKRPTVKIIVLTSWDRPADLASAMRHGADAFCSMENAASLTKVIQLVLAGETWIDPKFAKNETGKWFFKVAS